ncbi:MAG: hypothetical protein ORN27_04700 [Rhodoluna sp.]|nr:hypothetical protein [Rhodoluna sp.]
MNKLQALKAIAAAIGASGVIFNRGNAAVASVAVLVFAVLIFAVETITYRHRGFVASINLVGLVLTITFASLMGKLDQPFDRFFMLVVIASLFQLLSETVLNLRNGWFKKGNYAHMINWALHLIVWSLFALLPSIDTIGAIGIFGVYAGILAVHWGIEATGPKPLKQD